MNTTEETMKISVARVLILNNSKIVPIVNIDPRTDAPPTDRLEDQSANSTLDVYTGYTTK